MMSAPNINDGGIVMQKEEINLEEITKRLDIIIGFLMEQAQEKSGASNREIIGRLSESGLKDTEIANILCRTRGYVSSELVKYRANKGKKEKKK